MSLPTKNWYYTRGGQQVGPVGLAQIRHLLESGHIDRDADLLWAEGQPDWKPASTMEGLEANPDPHEIHTSSLHPELPGGPPIPFVEPVRFGLIAWLGVGALAALLSCGFLFGFGSSVPGRDGPPDATAWSPLLMLGMLALILGLGLLIAAVVCGCIALYRAWLVIQPFQVRLTPGLAIGPLFVPLFNLYWAFQSLWGWSRDYNRAIASDPSFEDAPRATAGLFLAYCILSALRVSLSVSGALVPSPLLEILAGVTGICNLVLILLCARQICAAVNYFSGYHGRARR